MGSGGPGCDMIEKGAKCREASVAVMVLVGPVLGTV